MLILPAGQECGEAELSALEGGAYAESECTGHARAALIDAGGGWDRGGGAVSRAHEERGFGRQESREHGREGRLAGGELVEEDCLAGTLLKVAFAPSWMVEQLGRCACKAKSERTSFSVAASTPTESCSSPTRRKKELARDMPIESITTRRKVARRTPGQWATPSFLNTTLPTLRVS